MTHVPNLDKVERLPAPVVHCLDPERLNALDLQPDIHENM